VLCASGLSSGDPACWRIAAGASGVGRRSAGEPTSMMRPAMAYRGARCAKPGRTAGGWDRLLDPVTSPWQSGPLVLGAHGPSLLRLTA